MSLDDQATDNSQFESGYTNEPTEKPVPEVRTETKEAKAKAQENVAPKVDPLKELSDRFEKLEKGHTTLAGRFGGLQNSQKEIQDYMAAAKAATKAVDDAPTDAQVKEAMKNPDEWEDLKTAFPEWATATEKFMDAKLATLKVPQVLDPARVEKMIADVEAKVTNSSLNAVFPGWKKEVATPEFDKWLTSQAEDVKALAGSDEIEDAARMLKLYELSKQVKPAPVKDVEPKKEISAREKQLKAALIPKGSGGHSASSSELDEFESGYNS